MTQELTQLREALRRVKYEAVSLADAQVIALEALTAAQPAQAEREQLRSAQADAVMTLIGPLLDAWENADRDVMSLAPELSKQLKAINNAMEGTAQPTQPAQTGEREAWVPYLVDRADGVKGHYAIGRWNPRGYREVWNLHSHRWAAYSDDVMSLEEADSLLRQITIPTARASLPTQPAAQATPEPVGGPVAWRYKIPTHGGGTAWTHTRPQPECLIEAQPLYTHPAPGVPDGEPKLTQEELLEVAKHAWLMARTADSLQFYRTLLAAAAQAKGADHD